MSSDLRNSRNLFNFPSSSSTIIRQDGIVRPIIQISTAPGSGNKGDYRADWVALSLPSAYLCSLKLGTQTLFDVDPVTDANTLYGLFRDDTAGWAAVTDTGSQTVEIKMRNASGYKQQFPVHMFFDDLAIMLDTNMTFKALQGGQVIELYDSGGTLRKSGTCPGTGIDVVFTGIDAMIDTAYGFIGYFKVYDTDGITWLYTSPTTSRWGGDVYTWVPNESKMEITTTYTRIFTSGSGLSPTECTVTATLKDKQTEALLVGKTIDWIGNLGTVAPASDVTDGNGEAETVFSAGSSAGLGGVRGTFAGDATYGPCTIIQLIDIYETDPAPDSTKEFQVYVAGQELIRSAGNYKRSCDFTPQAFSITTPILDVDIGGWWAVEIYRWGTIRFVGRIMKGDLKSGLSPQLTVSGVDEKVLLQRRVANKVYTDEPKTIIEDLLVRYPCGVIAGTIATYGSAIKLPASYENLFDALAQIAKITGWKFNLNPNRSLDFGPDFGTTLSVTIELGKNEIGATHDYDWSKIDAKVYVVGQGAAAVLVSEASDETTELTYGLIEEAFLEKGITEQGTLDLRCAEILNERKVMKETISVEWTDMDPQSDINPFDTITVTDPDAELSGDYRIYSVTRDLANAAKATLELSNKTTTMGDLLQSVRKDVKDLGVQ